MKIITIKMSEEGRDEIITSRVSISDEGYALAYFNSVEAGFITFSAFTVLDVSMEDAPTLDQILVHAEQCVADEMMDKMADLEDDIVNNRTPQRFDDFITDDETGEEVGIVYPENAAPEHDEARALIAQAVQLLRSVS